MKFLTPKDRKTAATALKSLLALDQGEDPDNPDDTEVNMRVISDADALDLLDTLKNMLPDEDFKTVEAIVRKYCRGHLAEDRRRMLAQDHRWSAPAGWSAPTAPAGVAGFFKKFNIPV